MGHWMINGDDVYDEELYYAIEESVRENISYQDVLDYVDAEYKASDILVAFDRERVDGYDDYKDEAVASIVSGIMDTIGEGNTETRWVDVLWVEDYDPEDDEPSFNRKPLRKGSRKNRGRR